MHVFLDISQMIICPLTTVVFQMACDNINDEKSRPMNVFQYTLGRVFFLILQKKF